MKLHLYSIYLGFYHAFRLGSFGFFSTSNTAIKTGGMFDEEKTDIYELLPKEILPKTVIIKGTDRPEFILNKMKQADLSLPVFIKPNIGFRGYKVEKINTENELFLYFKNAENKDFLIQEFVDKKNEYAILYYQYPISKKSGILSLSSRSYPHIVGDGLKSIAELTAELENTRIDKDSLLEKLPRSRSETPAEGEIINLDYVGNFIRGSAIINEESSIDEGLVSYFDKLVSPIEGLNFVRFDAKADSIEDIKNGDLVVLEMNGAKSESMHKYDESISMKDKMQVLRKHWRVLAEISKERMSQGYKPDSFTTTVKAYLRLNKTLKDN